MISSAAKAMQAVSQTERKRGKGALNGRGWSGWVTLSRQSAGKIAKYFGAVLNIAVSTTLLSYLAIFPALWRLRVTHPDQPRPFKAPFPRFLSVWLTACIAFAALEIIAPGVGVDWFGGEFTPKGWAKEERVSYLVTELVPLVVFLAVGVLFWVLGASTRRETERAAAASGMKE